MVEDVFVRYVFASMLLIHKFSVYDCLPYPPLTVDGSLLYPDLSCQRQTSHWLEKLHYAGLTTERISCPDEVLYAQEHAT